MCNGPINSKAMAYQGWFKPKNPQKYKGDPTNIQYRSGWELKLMAYLDNHPEILQWSSEEIVIPYRSPKDNRVHRYFPDFWIKKTDGSVSIIEVKPLKEVKEPVATPKKRKGTFLREVITYGINQAKWKAAKEYCFERGWNFQVITEKELGI